MSAAAERELVGEAFAWIVIFIYLRLPLHTIQWQATQCVRLGLRTTLQSLTIIVMQLQPLLLAVTDPGR